MFFLGQTITMKEWILFYLPSRLIVLQSYTKETSRSSIRIVNDYSLLQLCDSKLEYRFLVSVVSPVKWMFLQHSKTWQISRMSVFPELFWINLTKIACDYFCWTVEILICRKELDIHSGKICAVWDHLRKLSYCISSISLL